MDKMILHLFLVVLLSSSMLAGKLTAQAGRSYTHEQARADITGLKDGFLVVRLQGEQRKLEVLDELIGNASETERVKLEEQKRDIIHNRDSFNLHLIDAFSAHFTFCPVYYIYDHDSRVLLDSTDNRPVLLDSLGQPDESIDWPDGFYLGLRVGESSNGAEGLIVTDSLFRDLDSPFPRFVQKNSLGSALNWLLARDIYWWRNAERMAEKLNRNLWRFYNKM
jgi:hypothetical protein